MRVPPDQSVTVAATRSSARSRSRSRSRRVTRVRRVPKTNASVRTSDRGQGLSEAEQEPGVALHRDRDVADEHDRRAAAAPGAARPRSGGRRRSPGCAGTWPAGRVRRPCRWSSQRRVRRRRELRHEPVDEARRLAQLGGASCGRSRGGGATSPCAVGVGGDGDDLAAPPRPASSGRPPCAGSSSARSRPSPASASAAAWSSAEPPRRRLAGSVVEAGAWRRQKRSKTSVVGRQVLAAAHEERRAGRLDLVAVAQVAPGAGPGRSRARRPGRRPGRPRAACARRGSRCAAGCRRGPSTAAGNRARRGRWPTRRQSSRRPPVRRRGTAAVAGSRFTWRTSSWYLRSDAERLVDERRRQLLARRAPPAPRPSRASRRCPGPWSGRPRAAAGRRPRPGGPGRSGTSGRRVSHDLVFLAAPSGSRSSGTGSGA